MSNIPSDPGMPQNSNIVPSYAMPMRRSGLALWSMVLGIVAIPTTFVVIGIGLGIAALVLGIIALVAMAKDHYLGGKGMAITGVVTGGFAILGIPLVIAILIPSLGRSVQMSDRASCAANIGGVIKGLNLYANENADVFPTPNVSATGTAFQMVSNGLTIGGASTAGDTTSSKMLLTLNGPTAPTTAEAESITTPLWMLVMKGIISPKEMICRSDPSFPTASDQTTPASPWVFYDNFGNAGASSTANTISYSIAYPYLPAATGMSVSGVWKATVDSSLPIMADIAPQQGTGTPARVLNDTISVAQATPGYPQIVNSNNHGGEGQVVGFSDAHVDFDKNSYVGQGGDNIYNAGTSSPADNAATPLGSNTGTVPTPCSTVAPYDVIMVPIRNASTGGM